MGPALIWFILVVWLVLFLTMLGYSFLTWLDLGYCLLGDGGSFANHVR